jgi:hypothetical protein
VERKLHRTIASHSIAGNALDHYLSKAQCCATEKQGFIRIREADVEIAMKEEELAEAMYNPHKTEAIMSAAPLLFRKELPEAIQSKRQQNHADQVCAEAEITANPL